MFDDTQLIEMQWVTRNRKRYEALGYKFTKLFDTFLVEAKDLAKGSDKYVDVVCDYCGNVYKQEYKHQHSHKGKDCCKGCWQQKAMESMKNKYGVEYPLQKEEFREKYKQTCFERFGYASHLSSPGVRDKILNSYYLHGTCPTSTQQIEVASMLAGMYGGCGMNVPCGQCLLDCVIDVNGDKLNIEYDGVYWHQDAQKDRRRDEYVKSQGYKILRIKAKRLVPTEAQLKEKIDYLVKGNHSYAELKLDI